MQPAERPQSLADLAGRLGMVVYADAVPASPGAAGASQQASPPVGGAHLRQPAAKRGKPVWIGLLLALVIVGGTFGWFQSGRAPNALITSSELMPPNPPMVRPEAPAQPSAPQAEPQVARAEPPGLQPAQQTVPVLVAEFKPAAVADAAPPSTEALIGAARSWTTTPSRPSRRCRRSRRNQAPAHRDARDGAAGHQALGRGLGQRRRAWHQSAGEGAAPDSRQISGGAAQRGSAAIPRHAGNQGGQARGDFTRLRIARGRVAIGRRAPAPSAAAG